MMAEDLSCYKCCKNKKDYKILEFMSIIINIIGLAIFIIGFAMPDWYLELNITGNVTEEFRDGFWERCIRTIGPRPQSDDYKCSTFDDVSVTFRAAQVLACICLGVWSIYLIWKVFALYDKCYAGCYGDYLLAGIAIAAQLLGIIAGAIALGKAETDVVDKVIDTEHLSAPPIYFTGLGLGWCTDAMDIALTYYLKNKHKDLEQERLMILR